MTAYYNEHDPFAAAWLRELIKAGHIAPGEVDERSIEDVFPDDLRGFTQCHFFAGIGVWSYALRTAGWPDDRPVWTGSCPCQPFSTAGKRKGITDERHLWPALFHLIRECQPATFFGEQVASKDGLAWIGTVLADLEGQEYTVGAADLCAAGFGAPHVRQRLYFVGDRSGANSYGGNRDGRDSSLQVGRQWRQKDDAEVFTAGRTQWATESRPSPVAYGITNRMGLCNGFGNALVAPVATAFIEAFLEATEKTN